MNSLPRSALPELHGERVLLRPVSPGDIPTLEAILADPAVACWWHRTSWERVDTPDHATFAIELDGHVAGCIQYEEEDDPDYRQAGIDLFVAGRFQDRGVGSDALRTMIDHLLTVRGHHRITIDPAAANDRAVHVYGKLGFRQVGVMRRYERGADGAWRDALLMELVVGPDGRPLR